MTISKQTLMMCLFVAPLALTGCPGDDTAETTDDASETGDGDGDPAGDGDGDSSGDGDGDTSGDGDGDTSGDGDGDSGDGDGDEPPPDPIVFADNPPEDYTRVDRAGMPAVNTALIASKDEYNQGSPEGDVAMEFVGEIVASITGLHEALDPALISLDLLPCDVDECIAQGAPLVLPDTLKIDTELGAGFPNGRGLADPVMDVTLAVLLLDLTFPNQDAFTFANLPLNPPANDVAFEADFPYLAAPN